MEKWCNYNSIKHFVKALNTADFLQMCALDMHERIGEQQQDARYQVDVVWILSQLFTNSFNH